MMLIELKENYWTGSWREFVQGDEVPEEGTWVVSDSIPTKTLDMRERRCWKYCNETKSFILDGSKFAEYNAMKINKEKLYEIRKLKAQLSSTDYKVIKSYELNLAGETPEYNITSLHKERQVIRDKINLLENELENN